MAYILVGAIMMAGFLLIVDYVRRRELKSKWWHWVLTALGFLYGVLVLALVVGFLEEGSGQAALVMGVLMGVVAVVYGVFVSRFVFTGSGRTS